MLLLCQTLLFKLLFLFLFFLIRTGLVNTFDLILCRIFYCAKWFFLYIYIYLHYIAYCIYTCVSTHVVKLCSTWHRLWYFFFKFINILLWEQVGYILLYIFDETIRKILFKVLIYRFVRLFHFFTVKFKKTLRFA